MKIGLVEFVVVGCEKVKVGVELGVGKSPKVVVESGKGEAVEQEYLPILLA